MSKKKSKNDHPSFFQAIKEIITEMPKGVWIFFIGAGLGAGILGLIWAVSSSGTDIPHAQIKEGDQTYQIVYNGKTKTPTWVVQTLNSDIKEIDETRYNFQQDPKISPLIQPQVADYEGSGFDIGLLVFPAAFDDIKKLFYLTNAAPFVPEFKNGYWKKLNAYIANLTKDNTKIVVISGPLYISEEAEDGKNYVKYQVIGKSKVAVPSHFFRIIYTSGNPPEGPEIYVVPNKKISETTPLKSFQIKSEEFEKISGLLLPEETMTYFFQPAPPI